MVALPVPPCGRMAENIIPMGVEQLIAISFMNLKPTERKTDQPYRYQFAKNIFQGINDPIGCAN